MTFSLFSIAILLIFFSVTATEVYRSIKKGFRMTLISLAIVVFSVIFSALVTYLISEVISSLVSYLILNNLSVYRELVQDYSWVNVFVEAIMGMVLGSLLFVAVFFAVRAITQFIVRIVCKSKIRRFADTPEYCKEENSYFDQNDKVLSVITGVIVSVVVTMVITSPIMGTLDVANKTLSIVGNFKLSETDSVTESANEIDLSVYANDFCGNVFYQLGGKLMYYSAASAEVYGERVHLISEADALVDVFDDLKYTYSAFVDPQNATDEQISRIYGLCDNVERLELFSGALGEYISSFATAWKNGDRVFGIAKPVTNDLIEPAFDEILSVCQNTDHHSAKANMITLLKLYAAVMDSDLFAVNMSNFNSLVEYVNESDIVGRLDAILKENPNMSGISVSSIAMAAVSKYIREFDYDSSKYNVLMEDIADAINKVNDRGYSSEEEKAKVLASYAREYIKEYGITLPDDMATSVAEEILKHLGGSTVTEEDVRRIFSKYAK